MFRVINRVMNRVMNRIENRVVHRVVPRDRVTRDDLATVLSNKDAPSPSLIAPLVAPGYRDVTEDVEDVTGKTTKTGTDNDTEDMTENNTKDDSSEPSRISYTSSSSNIGIPRGPTFGGGTCHTYSKSRVSAGIIRARMIMILCLSSVSAFTPANLYELKNAKTTCLKESLQGIPPWKLLHI